MRKAPLFIRLFSYFFIFMAVVATGTLALAWLSPGGLSEISVSFLTNRLVFTEHPILFTAAFLFFVFSGITGFTIVMKRSYAYDLGIACCMVGLVFFNVLIFLKIGLVSDPMTSMVIQAGVFGGFLTYLVRHRTEWKKPSGARDC